MTTSATTEALTGLHPPPFVVRRKEFVANEDGELILAKVFYFTPERHLIVFDKYHHVNFLREYMLDLREQYVYASSNRVA